MVSQCSRYCLCLAVTFLKFFHIDSVDFLFTTPKNCDTRNMFLTKLVDLVWMNYLLLIRSHQTCFCCCPLYHTSNSVIRALAMGCGHKCPICSDTKVFFVLAKVEEVFAVLVLRCCSITHVMDVIHGNSSPSYLFY